MRLTSLIFEALLILTLPIEYNDIMNEDIQNTKPLIHLKRDFSSDIKDVSVKMLGTRVNSTTGRLERIYEYCSVRFHNHLRCEHVALRVRGARNKTIKFYHTAKASFPFSEVRPV